MMNFTKVNNIIAIVLGALLIWAITVEVNRPKEYNQFYRVIIQGPVIDLTDTLRYSSSIENYPADIRKQLRGDWYGVQSDTFIIQDGKELKRRYTK